MAFRTAIPDFQLGNPLYTGARVVFYLADENGLKTPTPATLYADATGPNTANNPQTLDSEGKFFAPVYIDAPVVAEAIFQNNESHVTGAIVPHGRWKGSWVTAALYVTGDLLREPGSGDERKFYLATQVFRSGASIAADIAAGNLELQFDPLPAIEGTEAARSAAQSVAAAAAAMIRRAGREAIAQAEAARGAVASFAAMAAKATREAKAYAVRAETALASASAFAGQAMQAFRRARKEAQQAASTADQVQIAVGGPAGAAASHARRAKIAAITAESAAATLTDDQIVLRSQVFG